MLQARHKTLDEIPEAYRELYTERDGEFHLTGVAGIKTQADIDRMQVGLNKEREDHKATKEKLRIWDGLDHDEVRGKLDRFTELELAAKGNKEEMDARLDELTEARVKSRLAPVERENANLKKEMQTISEELEALRAEKTRRQIHDKVREAVKSAKVLPEAESDVLLLADVVFEVAEDGTVLTKENPYGVTAGLAPDVFLTDMQEKRPHWWPTSVGGGASGSGGRRVDMSSNPWAADHWNLTEQGKIYRENPEKASQLAKAAGTTVGGLRPAKK